MVEVWEEIKMNEDTIITESGKDSNQQFADMLGKMLGKSSGKSGEFVIQPEMGKLPISIITSVKWKIFKGKNFAWVLKCSKTGGIKLLFLKAPKTIYYGRKRKDGTTTKTEITRIYHWFGGHPFHVCIEGMPVNVPLNKEIKISELAPHINSVIIHSHQIGMLRGMKLAIKGAFSNPFFVIALIIVIVAAIASAYFAMESLNTSKAVLGAVQQLIAENAKLAMISGG